MTDEINPYRPPASGVTPTSETWPLDRASRGRRFGTLLIDYVCFFACGFVLVIVIALAFGNAALQRVPDMILGSLIVICYYVFFESIWARTPGKLIFGTVVVNDAGGKPSLGQVITRTLCRFIPFEAFSFFGERGWHDRLSNTRVVRKRKP
jgi:uncharacterized RDD family membrane protein YckC